MTAPTPMPPAPPERTPGAQVLIVTGMSGAGRTSAVNVLEDLGYETLNNVPLSMVGAVVAPAAAGERPIAIGIETRTRGFSTRALIDAIAMLRQEIRVATLLVFLDCSDEVLLGRFSQTRRRHPLAPAEDAETGIARERHILEEVRARADLVIDTTGLSPNALKQILSSHFGTGTAPGLSVSVQSFSYKRGAPHDADMVLDCRFLRNPYWDAALRTLDGRDGRIQSFVTGDPRFHPFFDRLTDLLRMLLPAYHDEGKAYFSVALGCTGGRHRSVTVAELLAEEIGAAGWQVAVRHRELDGRSVSTVGQ